MPDSKKWFLAVPLASLALIPFIIQQKSREQALRAESNRLREAMNRPSPGPGQGGSGRRRLAAGADPSGQAYDEPLRADGGINWKRFSEVMLTGEVIGIRELRDRKIIEERLREMSGEELVAALEESRGLILSMRDRSKIDRRFISLLTEKDPVAALNAFAGELNGKYRHDLGIAFEALTKQDIAGAARWLDEQVAAGRMQLRSLHGEDYVRSEYERALIEVMLASDIEAASARLGQMPEDLRWKTLVNADTTRLSAEQTQAMARLVKEQLSESAQAEVFSSFARDHIVGNDLSRVSEFLNTISPTERIASQCVEAVVEKSLGRGGRTRLTDLERLRGWAEGHLISDIDAAMGVAVGNALFGNGSPDASDLIVDYHAAHGSDDFVASVIENAYLLTDDQAERMLQAIQNEDRRREMRNLYEKR